MAAGDAGTLGGDGAALARAGAADVDVVVIGGGVNGTGVARDCALRGLSVLLLERNDLGFGASGNSSGMIHGGPRYLTDDPDVTYTSCLDSGHIQEIAPHLLFRIPFLMPVAAKSTGARVMLEALDAFFRVYDRYQPLKHGKPHTRLNASELLQLEPGLAGPVLGGVTFDEWGIDGSRLCVANALDAEERGARLLTHTTVTAIDVEAGRARAVRYRSRLTGESGVVRPRVVVNATGAWAPLTLALSALPPKHLKLRPGKGIHVLLDRRVTNYAIVASAIDGRQVFLEPWQNVTVLGTTDDDYYGDLDRVFATSEEVRYLVEAVARVFPRVTEARIIGTFAGVRPTLATWGLYEDKLSREHEIVDHREHGAAGLYSMIGGKLASYRLFAEQLTNRVAADLGVTAPCRTHESPLPGGERVIEARSLEAPGRLDPIAARRLEYRHGARAERIVERIQRNPVEARVVCDCEPVTEAEVRHVIATEHAATVEDVSRRTRLGLGACGGMRCAARCGRLVAEMTGRSPEEGTAQAVRFLETAARRRAPGLHAQQARQEALTLASLRAELGRGFEGKGAAPDEETTS